MPFMNPTKLRQISVAPDEQLHSIIETLGRGAKQVVLIVDEYQKMLGIVTDGDLRRAILRNVALDTPVQEIMTRDFIAAPVGLDSADVLSLMQNHGVQHIPLLDGDGQLFDLVWLSDLLAQDMPRFQALIMAGGFGRRLHPLTDDLPKPLLPVGGRPLMELIIDQLRQAGTNQFHVSTHYMANKIVEYFGDGSRHKVHIEYIKEEHPLGTAGVLGLMTPLTQPLLVINGDILTRLDFRAMLAFHEDHQATLTVAVKEYSVDVPYGVLQTEDVYVRSLQEKPTLRFFINAGIYLVSPEAQQLVPKGRSYNMTDLIEQLIANGEKVASFPIQEYWLDIGQHVDYEQAQLDVQDKGWSL